MMRWGEASSAEVCPDSLTTNSPMTVKEEVQLEMEAVAAVYGEDCHVCLNFPLNLVVRVRPSTAGDFSKQFVELTFGIKISSQYPDEAPYVYVVESKGLDVDRLKSLINRIQEKANKLSSYRPMLVTLCKEAEEILSDLNHPAGDCLLCLEPLVSQDNHDSALPIMKLMSCYHCFHSDCITRWWGWLQHDDGNSKKIGTTVSTGVVDSEGVELSDPDPDKLYKLKHHKGFCPVCRKVFDEKDIEHVRELLDANTSRQMASLTVGLGEDDQELLHSEAENKRERHGSLFNLQQEQNGLIEQKKNHVIQPEMKPLESKMENSVKMYFIILMGSAFCIYHLGSPWTLQPPLPDLGSEDQLLIPTSEEYDGGPSNEVTEGLFVVLNDTDEIISHCWLHIKSPPCHESNENNSTLCMLGCADANILCIRISQMEKFVAASIFGKKDEGLIWKSTSKMMIQEVDNVKAISDLIRMKFGTAGQAVKYIASDESLVDNLLEFHGQFKEFNFSPLSDVNFDQAFQVEQLLGTVSFGKVQRCICLFNEKIYAVKICKLREIDEPSEIRALALLNHKNIVQLNYAWRDHGYLNGVKETVACIAMECCDRTLLQALPFDNLQALSGMQLSDKKILFEQVVSSVYMHSKGILHRDVKPDNVVLHENIPKLADMGCAVIKSSISSTFRGAKRLGSKLYCAPELEDDYKHHTEKVDVYSAGILYYLLHCPDSGNPARRLVHLMNLHNTAKAWGRNPGHTNEYPTLFDGWTGNINLLKRMLQIQPGHRISAAELLGQLLDE